jgi:hypothetical protein
MFSITGAKVHGAGAQVAPPLPRFSHCPSWHWAAVVGTYPGRQANAQDALLGVASQSEAARWGTPDARDALEQGAGRHSDPEWVRFHVLFSAHVALPEASYPGRHA